MMLDWDDLRSFLAIARHRTLSGAARALSVQQSTMGRRLDALEERAGVILLQKTPGGYLLTGAGEAVLGHVERIEQETLAIERTITGRDVRLEGNVRLTTVETMAVDILTPILTAFLARYPGITLDLVTDTRTLSLSRREADVAVRLIRPEGHELVARKIGEIGFGLYASPGYLEQMGMPDLEAGAPGHRAILSLDELTGAAETAWIRDAFSQTQVALRTNSRYAHAAAAEAGVGIAGLTHYLAQGRNLVRLPTPTPTPRREVWLAVHEDTRHTPRIRALMEALTAGLKDQAHRLLGD
ncbi:MAG: LysR family transcriptional regulator [Alphaproteobacteria bacterium]|nr:LysR family transcriptional regulator [Alphaproteobacteria bacterium]